MAYIARVCSVEEDIICMSAIWQILAMDREIVVRSLSQPANPAHLNAWWGTGYDPQHAKYP